MKIDVVQGSWLAYKTPAFVVGIFEDDKGEVAKALDAKFDGLLTDLTKEKAFTGEEGQVHTIDAQGNVAAAKVILVGLGKKEEVHLDCLRKAAALGAKAARDMGAKSLATNLQECAGKSSLKERAQTVTEGMLLGLYRFIKYKTLNVDKVKHLQSITFVAQGKTHELLHGIRKGEVLASHANRVKDMANAPPNVMTPLEMANTAKRLAKEAHLKCTIYDKKKIQKLGFNGLLAVNSGSVLEPRFIILDYNPKNAKKTIALVGKGITFDSGGIQIKPGKGMGDMKYDMTGGAIMMHTVAAASKLKLPHRVVAFVPSTENMPGGSAYKPSDIITMYNGKTVEINHTDAEGRVILGDALAYAVDKLKPDMVIDAATLTGAAIVVLGDVGAVIMSNNDTACRKVEEAACYTEERVWRLPIWDYHRDLVKAINADISNVGLGPKGYEAGSIEGAAFLEHFVKDTPWVHIDLAGPVWSVQEKDYKQIGSTGYGVRLVFNTLERL